MAGVYIHIPFCRQRCHYCDFHSRVAMGQVDAMVKALVRELELRKNYLHEEKIRTIYFGGGTPSILEKEHLDALFSTIYRLFSVQEDAEVTLEANPDDLDEAYLQMLMQTPVNRLSIGIQSFRDEDLQLMNRRHTGDEAFDAVRRAQGMGFHNISIDLIYGVPGLSMQGWSDNIDRALELGVPHISAYHLTFEPKTVFGHYLKKGELKPIDEEMSLDEFKLLIKKLTMEGFQHYEISNFAKEGWISRHNSSYWKGVPYLGIGPGAHSYDGSNRQWNISNNTKYIESVTKGEKWFEKEDLSTQDQYNDYVITSLRTSWGVDLSFLEESFGASFRKYFEEMAASYLKKGLLVQQQEKVCLGVDGIFVSDQIMSDLLFVE